MFPFTNRVVPELDKVSVYARHIYYDLMDNMIQSFKPLSSAAGASVVQGISSHCLSEHGFTFYSDLASTAEEVAFENMNPVDAIMGDEGFIANYGGELQRDWLDVFLVERMGHDMGIGIFGTSSITAAESTVCMSRNLEKKTI